MSWVTKKKNYMQKSIIIAIQIVQTNKQDQQGAWTFEERCMRYKCQLLMLEVRRHSFVQIQFLEASVPEQFQFLIPGLSAFQRIRSQFFTVPILVNNKKTQTKPNLTCIKD